MSALPDFAGDGALVLPAEGGFLLLREGTRREVARLDGAAAAIQTAIDAQPAGGGSVRLGQGEYRLERPLRLRPRLRLAGAGRATRLLAGDAEGILGEGADGCEVAELAVHGGRRGIVLADCGEALVRDCTVSGCTGHGLVLERHCFLSALRGCSVHACGQAGILLGPLAKGRVGDYLPNSVQHCQTAGGGTGILCDNAVVANLVGCTVLQASGAAYHLRSIANSVLISGCRSFQIEGHALLVEGSQELNCTGNIFCWHTREGILLRDVRWGVVAGNEVIDNGSFNPDAPDQTLRFDALGALPALSGIVLENCQGINVSGNTVFNWPQGTRMGTPIREDAAGLANVIQGNYANYYAAAAPVEALGRDGLVAHNHGIGPEPHISSSAYPLIQSFQPERLRAWLQGLRG